MEPYNLDIDNINNTSYSELEKELSEELNKIAKGVVGFTDNKGETKSVFDFNYDVSTDILSVRPTDSGEAFLMNAFGEKAISGQEINILLSNIDKKVISKVFGQDFHEKNSFDEFIESSKQRPGKLIVSDSAEALLEQSERTITIVKSQTINSLAGTFGRAIKSNNESKGLYTAQSIDVGQTDGLRSVSIKGVSGNDNTSEIKSNNEKLAIEHALQHSLQSTGTLTTNSSFHVNPDNGLAMIVTTNNIPIIGANKNDIGYTHRAKHLNKSDNQISLNEFITLKSGKNIELGEGEAIQKLSLMIKGAGQKTKEAVYTQLLLAKLVGSKTITGNDIVFNKTAVGKNLSLKLAPIENITPHLMDNPSHADIIDAGLQDKALGDLTLSEIVSSNSALHNIYQSDPELMKNSFLNALKVRKEMIRYIEQEMEPASLVSPGTSSSFEGYINTPIETAGVSYLKDFDLSPFDGQSNSALQTILERNAILDERSDLAI
jgi:hypothetical protein